jgi:hypothetical protein
LVSILDPDWPVPPTLGAYGEHDRLELRFDDAAGERENPAPQ